MTSRTFILTITTDYPDGERAARDAAQHAVDRIGWGDDNTSSFELIETHESGPPTYMAGWEFEPGGQSDTGKASAPTATCKHCGRLITLVDGRWVDPEATDDDVIWRETCDAHDTFTAEHEPIPNFIWPDPSGDGWIDAWNGWYDTLERALDEALAGVGRPWRLKHGQGLLPAE